METVYQDYAPKGVKFYYIYKALAHPETNGYVTPFTLKERLLHVKEAQRTLGSGITWLCDTMSNDIKHHMGNAPNSEFIVDPDLKVVRRRVWSDPAQVRKDLEQLVGTVENPTKVDDLKLEKVPPPKVAPSGVVPRIKVPGPMRAVKVKPGESKTPYYAKLRAEADEQLLRQRKGKLYLGFRMDPLYHVHWNNLAAPIHFEIKAPPGVTVSPAMGEGPKVKQPADIDPREFLIDITADKTDKPLELTVRYFACNDDEGWCKPVTQRYAIMLEMDPDGGRVMRRNRSARGPRRPGSAGRPMRRPGVHDMRPGVGQRRMPAPNPNMLARIKANDKNGDGKITRQEASPVLKRFFSRLDADGDGVIDQQELERFSRRGRDGAKREPRAGKQSSKLVPTHQNVQYGPHERNELDFWQVDSKTPTPLVLFIHGGGFRAGSKEKIDARTLEQLLDAGISVAAVNYRYVSRAPLPAAHHDCRRALQFLRSKAKQWNIDKKRVGAFGGSAGAQICMYLAFHDEMANPNSSDPIERESTRLACVATMGGQTTMDFDWWTRNVPGYKTLHRDPREVFGAQSKDEYLRKAADVSALSLISKDDPPILMTYGMAPDAPVPDDAKRASGWKVHHVIFGVKLKEKMDALGVEADLHYPGARSRHGSIATFLIQKLAGKDGNGS